MATDKPVDDLDDELDSSSTEVALPDSDEIEVEVIQDEPEAESQEAETGTDETTSAAAEEEQTAADAPVDADLATDEEYNAFDPKIQKRIQRELRIRRQAEHAANLAVTRVREVEQQAQQLLQTREAQASQLREANNELQRQYAEVLVHAFGNQIELKLRDLKAARDAGEFETEQKIQAEVDDLRFKHNQVKDMQRSIPAPVPQQKQQPQVELQPRPAPTPAPSPTAPVNPRVSKWLKDNASWFNNAKFADHRKFVLNVVDKEVAAAGYDQNSIDYYKELDRRIDAVFPTLRRKSPVTSTSTNKSAPVAGVSPSGNGARRSTKITLNQSDLETMRRFNLDPSNKDHLREFAKNIRSNKEAS